MENHPVERWGPEAAAFVVEFVRACGGRVTLEADGELTDHYDRWLRFVWHGDRMLNEELVRHGLARAMVRYDYGQAKKERLRAAQLEAQRAGRGIWSTP
jgi:micrococcal nuclease